MTWSSGLCFQAQASIKFTLPEVVFSPTALYTADEVSLLSELFQKPFPILKRVGTAIRLYCLHQFLVSVINFSPLFNIRLWAVPQGHHASKEIKWSKQRKRGRPRPSHWLSGPAKPWLNWLKKDCLQSNLTCQQIICVHALKVY